MSDINPIIEQEHDELLELLNPLLDFMKKREYSFFLLAGKDGLCSRHLLGTVDEISEMMLSMMESHHRVENLIKDTADTFSNKSI